MQTVRSQLFEGITNEECARMFQCFGAREAGYEAGALISEFDGEQNAVGVLLSGSGTNLQAIIDEIEDKLREEASIKPTHREMSADGSWSLLDYGNIVVHVFMPETREYYRLEALWNDAPVIDLAAEAGLENLQYSDRIAKLLGREAAQGDEA